MFAQLTELVEALESEVRCELAAFMARSAELLIEQARRGTAEKSCELVAATSRSCGSTDAGHTKVTPRPRGNV